MDWDVEEKPDRLIWKFESLRIHDLTGTIPVKLTKLEDKIKACGLEWAPPTTIRTHKDMRQEDIVLYHITPPFSIEVLRADNRDAVIRAYSLENNKTEEVLDNLIGCSGFKSLKEAGGAINEEVLFWETDTYLRMKSTAEMNQTSLEQEWGYVRYLTFLEENLKFPRSHAIEIAKRAYSLR